MVHLANQGLLVAKANLDLLVEMVKMVHLVLDYQGSQDT